LRGQALLGAHMKILVTGATGYIGGRLIPLLLERGHEVRVLVRDRSRVDGRLWKDRVEICVGDVFEQDSLTSACADMDAAYYLVHSMYAGSDFKRMDRMAAENFVRAGAHLKKVIYLGGLMPPNTSRSSSHLASRAEVGEVLRAALPVTEFRAGPIIGSGSASFEMIRYLTERIPVMITPKWVLNEVQAIGVRDMLAYLCEALNKEALGVVEVGADARAFLKLMQIYASVRGLRPRTILPMPVLAPRLAARWVGFITPIPNTLAVPLVQGMIQPLLADTTAAKKHFPDIHPVNYREAVERAIAKTLSDDVETRWSGALGPSSTYELSDWNGLIRETRTIHVAASPERVFQAFSELGGEKGWLVWNWAWRLRGFMDRMAGGPGLRRGRRHPHDLQPGEALDFWRVEAVKPPSLLRLRAEMKVPGLAWLQFETQSEADGTRLVQQALFLPKGLPGTLYWKMLHPFHKVIFGGMIKALAREATEANDEKG
jgi:uncharacterized protein YbjT (DUF2867 family)/uncharacterized protein YndB with AHSA1/START domain